MGNNKRPLIPFFLQKADDALLRNKPAVWQTRIHLVLFFAVLFAVVLSLFCFMVFFDARQYSNLSGWVSLTGLVVFIGFVFWLIFLLRFNVFKRFGNWHTWDGLKNFLLYFISIGAMVAVCFIPSSIETYRANQQFGNEEIVNDINEINTTTCKLEYNILPLKWTADTCRVVDTIPAALYTEADTPITAVAPAEYQKIDTAELRRRLAESDSTVKLHDTLYVFFDCPDYLFINSYNADSYTKTKILSSAAIYRSVLHNYQKPDRVALVKRMNALKTKWSVGSRYNSYNDNTYGEDESYTAKINRKYSLISISNGIDNTVRKKYAWKGEWEINLRVFYYVALVLTLLVFIFRHSTVKTFFLSVLTGVVMAIITGLLLLINYDSTETSFLSFIILYYIIFGAVALSVFGATTRKAIQGIGLNLFLFLTPFMPLVFVALNEAMRYRRYYDAPLQIAEPRNTGLYFLIAEITGAVLLLVLLELLFKKLYRRWFAAPEN